MRAVAIFVLAVFVAPAAQAMDCTLARKPVEKAICADGATLASDDAMGKAYGALKASLPPEGAAALLANQRAWLKRREGSCSDSRDAALAACVRSANEERTRQLAGTPRSGDVSAGALVPVIMDRKARRNGAYNTQLFHYRFAAPASDAERTFNRIVAAKLGDVPKDEPAADHNRQLTYDSEMTLLHVSPQLISAAITTYVDSGGAHGYTSVAHVNINGRTGKPLALSDLMGEARLKELQRDCVRQIRHDKQERLGEAQEGPEDQIEWAPDFAKMFAEVERWGFTGWLVSVVFNPYEVGSYAEGPYQCQFDTPELKAFMKAGALGR